MLLLFPLLRFLSLAKDLREDLSRVPEEVEVVILGGFGVSAQLRLPRNGALEGQGPFLGRCRGFLVLDLVRHGCRRLGAVERVPS